MPPGSPVPAVASPSARSSAFRHRRPSASTSASASTSSSAPPAASASPSSPASSPARPRPRSRPLPRQLQPLITPISFATDEEKHSHLAMDHMIPLSSQHPGAHPCDAEPSAVGSAPPAPASAPPASPTTPGASFSPRILPRFLRMNRAQRAPPQRLYSGSSSAAEEGGEEATPLVAVTPSGSSRWHRGPLLKVAIKLGILFAIFSSLVLGTFWFGMPPVDPEDRPTLKMPRSFEELQALNSLFQKYKHQYPGRILLCLAVAYLYVQAFTLPGSMYISILMGAAFGIMWGLVLSCLCEATGSVLCYTLSAILGPPLLELPYWRNRLEEWRRKIMGDETKGQRIGKDSIFAFLVVLRVMPLPPHWMANFVAPHLGIGVVLFWTACCIGIAPLSVIHVMIGSSLDQMTSAEDFHILSLRNILGLGAVVVAVLIPVGLKRVFRKDLGGLSEEAAAPAGVESEIPMDAPVPIEIGQHGLAKRFRAVDSGVNLAGPSSGDANLYDDGDDDPDHDRTSPSPARPARSSSKAKGKGRRPLLIIADVADTDSNDGSTSEYELGGAAPLIRTSPRRSEKGRSRFFRPFQGYGAIAPAAGAAPADAAPSSSASANGPTRWWRFGSGAA